MDTKEQEKFVWQYPYNTIQGIREIIRRTPPGNTTTPKQRTWNAITTVLLMYGFLFAEICKLTFGSFGYFFAVLTAGYKPFDKLPYFFANSTIYWQRFAVEELNIREVQKAEKILHKHGLGKMMMGGGIPIDPMEVMDEHGGIDPNKVKELALKHLKQTGINPAKQDPTIKSETRKFRKPETN